MATVELYWLPLGAGEPTGTVRLCGRAYEAVSAHRSRRARRALYHSALRVVLFGTGYVVEMAPVWSMKDPDRGVVGEGAVGLPALGRFRLFRYEVRCWPGGRIPDAAYAVRSPVRLVTDKQRVRGLLEAVREVPRLTWGLDELGAGEMWNSNSLISWSLTVSGHDLSAVCLPAGGRAPGWDAGVALAQRGTQIRAG